MPELTVMIPTIGGRDEMLARVTGAVKDEHPDAQIISIRNYSWGQGLNEIAQVATGRYWSCCCDDTVPVAGWFEAGRAMLDQGFEPASRYLTEDGQGFAPVDELEHGEPIPWCRSFLLTPEMYREVGPFIDATWYCDWDYSERLVKAGWEIRACDGFSFVHLDGDRGWLTPEEDARQRREYELSHTRQGIA